MILKNPDLLFFRNQIIRKYARAVKAGAGVNLTDWPNANNFINCIKSLGLLNDCKILMTCQSGQNAGTGLTAYVIYGKDGIVSGNGTLVNGATWAAGIQCAVSGNKYFYFPLTGLAFVHATHFHIFIKFKMPAIWAQYKVICAFGKAGEDSYNGVNSFILRTHSTETNLYCYRLNQAASGSWTSVVNGATLRACISFQNGSLKVRIYGESGEGTLTYSDKTNMTPDKLVLGAGLDAGGGPSYPGDYLISSAAIINGSLTNVKKDAIMAAMP